MGLAHLILLGLSRDVYLFAPAVLSIYNTLTHTAARNSVTFVLQLYAPRLAYDFILAVTGFVSFVTPRPSIGSFLHIHFNSKRCGCT